jgi:hypothetical protein
MLGDIGPNGPAACNRYMGARLRSGLYCDLNAGHVGKCASQMSVRGFEARRLRYADTVARMESLMQAVNTLVDVGVK